MIKSFGKDDEIVQLATRLREKIEQYPQEAEDESVLGAFDRYPVPEELCDDKSFAVFSDGACRGNPGPGAWGAIGQAKNGEIIFESSGVEVSTTNNRMELEGAISSLQSIISHIDEMGMHPSDSDVTIHLYSDSKYVIDGLDKWVDGWKKRGWKKADNKAPENIELWKNLDSLAEIFTNIQYHWVKGHAGHPQNERCDQLANNALDDAGF